MKIIQPDINLVYSYIIQTHRADHIPITKEHIKFALGEIKVEKGQKALEGVEKACCLGHFAAINYAVQLAPSVDFPAKSKAVLQNQYVSDGTLYWLRELHTKMMYPIADYGIKNGTGDLYLQPSHCGVYRYTPKQLAFDEAPIPELIPPILHHWLLEVASLDEEVRDLVDNPYGLTASQSQRIMATVKEIPFLFSCLQPFEDGNNRFGKLVENAFRMRWRLPWRVIYELEGEKYQKDLLAYQEGPSGFRRWVTLAAQR